MRIGVISDTHNHFDPKVRTLFAGVDHILHAGDIGLPRVILELESIAPVTAVTGNMDEGLAYKDTEVVELGGRKFLLHHIVDIHKPSATVKRLIAREKPDVVVFGHLHKPFNEVRDGRLYFNPGYAGKAKFGQARSVAILHCEESGVRAEFCEL